MKSGLYQHFKGKYYQVIGVSRHSETMEEFVVYKALYGEGGLWIRPLAMFNEEILVEGVKQPRFKYISSKTADEL